MDENILKECFAIRKSIICLNSRIKSNAAASRFTEANYCVINPIDYCKVGCSHCLYSSLSNTESPKITIEQAKKICQFLQQANTKQIVFSGGGEPMENLEVMRFILENISTLDDAVIVTSGFFGIDRQACDQTLRNILSSCNEKRTNKNWNNVSLKLRLSRDEHYCNRIPTDAIINIIDVIRDAKNKYDITLMMRTIIDDKNGELYKLKDKISAIFYPRDFEKNYYTIDGLPVCWMLYGDLEIPLLFKPKYFVGRERSSGKSYSFWDILKDEQIASRQFNLCIRGPRGQGHNYYENIIKGHAYVVSKRKKIITKYDYTDKQIALYILADGRVSINNGVPDNYLKIEQIKTWEDFLEKQTSDPLQNFLLEHGPLPLFERMKSIDSTLQERVEKNNFVFSISLNTLENACKRFVLMIEILQISGYDVTSYVSLYDRAISSIKNFRCNKNQENKGADPIIGNEVSIYAD